MGVSEYWYTVQRELLFVGNFSEIQFPDLGHESGTSHPAYLHCECRWCLWKLLRKSLNSVQMPNNSVNNISSPFVREKVVYWCPVIQLMKMNLNEIKSRRGRGEPLSKLNSWICQALGLAADRRQGAPLQHFLLRVLCVFLVHSLGSSFIIKILLEVT